MPLKHSCWKITYANSHLHSLSLHDKVNLSLSYFINAAYVITKKTTRKLPYTTSSKTG